MDKVIDAKPSFLSIEDTTNSSSTSYPILTYNEAGYTYNESGIYYTDAPRGINDSPIKPFSMSLDSIRPKFNSIEAI